MAEVQIQKISHRHDAILEFMICNPTAQLGEVARHFQVSQAWLSVIINSDVFRAKHEARGDEFFGAAIVPLREKIVGVASQAVEKLGEKLEVSSDGDFVLAVADKLLHRLGYAPAKTPPPAPGAINIQQNYSVSPDVLARARASFGQPAGRQIPAAPSALIGGEVEGELHGETILPPSEEVQSSGCGGVGAALADHAKLHPGDPAEGPACPGATLSGESVLSLK